MENQNKKIKTSKLESLVSDGWGKVAILIDSNDKSLSFIEILEVLKNNNIEVGVIEILNQGLNLLERSIWKDFSRVFIAINSDHKLSFGYIQGLLDILCLEYTGSGMLAAALAGDIIKSKKIWQIMGISTTPFIRFHANLDLNEMISLIGFPLAVKSIYLNDKRVFKVLHMEQLKEVFKNFENSNEVIIEPWIAGDEYIVHIIDTKALLPLKVSNWLMIEPTSGSQHDLQKHNQLLNIKGMQQLAMDAFMALGCSGFAAVHILKDLNGDCWVLSINTAPILTPNSNFATAAYNSSINFETLVEKVLTSSLIKKSYVLQDGKANSTATGG